MKNRTDIIGIIVVHCGIHFWPVHYALIGHAWFIVSDSFSALFLRVIKDFAVSTKFAIARIALGIAVALLFRIKIFVGFTLLWLVLVAPVVRVLLLVVTLLLLLTLLWSERRDVCFVGGVSVILLGIVDDVDHGPLLLVGFDSVVGEESVVSIIDCHPGLVLVR